MSGIWQYLQSSWERILFGCVGGACLVFTFFFLWNAQITSASAVFAMSFFSFFYANLARFKRFKGLGFEAELWEDKQKEAADLIDRLKNVVAVYTREIVMNNVMRGRWGGKSWQKRWSLLEELEGRHTELGQRIDFSDLKHDVESAFVFDICSPLASAVRQSIEAAKARASEDGTARFGSPISDIDGWNKYIEALRSIKSTEDQLFERARTENIAQVILSLAKSAEAALLDGFAINVSFKDGVIERLGTLATLVSNRPITVTPELISWADDRAAFSG